MNECNRNYCKLPGYQKGPHCREAQGFKWTSDDWCNCKCHVTKTQKENK